MHGKWETVVNDPSERPGKESEWWMEVGRVLLVAGLVNDLYRSPAGEVGVTSGSKEDRR